MKRIVFAFALAIALSGVGFAFAQDKCTVSGEVVYSGNSNIYIYLHNSTSWTAFATRQKELPAPEFVQIVKVTGSGKVSFAFNEVPKGEYVIQAFADETANAKMDCDLEGYAIEPRAFFKPRPHHGLYVNWHEQKFMVDKDATGIILKLH